MSFPETSSEMNDSIISNSHEYFSLSEAGFLDPAVSDKTDILDLMSRAHGICDFFSNRIESNLNVHAYCADTFKAYGDDVIVAEFSSLGKELLIRPLGTKYLLVKKVGEGLINPILSNSIVFDFVAKLDAVAAQPSSVGSFTCKHLSSGVPLDAARLTYDVLVSAISGSWCYGIPEVFGQIALYRQCMAKLAAHVELHGPFMYHEQLRMNRNVAAYNCMRTEFAITCGGPGCSLGASELFMSHSAGLPHFLEPTLLRTSSREAFTRVPLQAIDDYPTPMNLLTNFFGKVSCYDTDTFKYTWIDEEYAFSSYLPRALHKPKISNCHVVNAICHSRLVPLDPLLAVSIRKTISAQASHLIEQARMSISRQEWNALCGYVPGFADGVLASHSGRYFFDENFAKVLACRYYRIPPPNVTSYDDDIVIVPSVASCKYRVKEN